MDISSRNSEESRAWLLRYCATAAVLAVLWWVIYAHVQAAASWLVFDVLSLKADSRLGPALEFFL